MISSDPQVTAEAVVVHDVSVVLGAKTVLDHVSFTLQPGSVTGLIGANGAGKTTLFRVILGIQPTTSGTVTIAGRPIARKNGTIGYVPQKVDLDPDVPLRARDLVALGVDGARFGLRRRTAQRSAKIEELLESLRITDFADRRIGELSGGQQQRVLIAHALARGPRLLLLDEPLANLDLRSADEVTSLLAQLASRHHVAVLISAHDINALVRVMDRVVYLAQGRGVSGPADEVVTSEVLTRLFGFDVTVARVAGRILVVAGGAEEPHGH